MSSRALFVVGAGLLAFLVAPSEGEACSPPYDGVLYRLLPAPSSSNIPTNTRLVLRWSNMPGDEAFAPILRVRLLGPAGEEIALDLESFTGDTRSLVARPQQELQAQTLYQILIPDFACMRVEEECFSEDFVVAGEFTTGTGPDHTAPVFVGGVTVGSSEFSCLGEECSCDFDFIVASTHLQWPVADDDGPVLYSLQVDGASPPRNQEQFSRDATLAKTCFGNAVESGIRSTIDEGETYIARAVDLAGNLSEDVITLTDVSVTCSATPDPDPDPDPAPPAKDSDAGGCQSAGQRDAGGTVWLLLALLAFFGWPAWLQASRPEALKRE